MNVTMSYAEYKKDWSKCRTYHILGLYADDFRGASLSDFDCATAEESAWIAKALQIVNK